MSQFFLGPDTQTCHPLSMFGMLWIDVYDSVNQLAPISSNFTAIEEWDNIPHATINSLINFMRRKLLRCMRQIKCHTRYWLVFWSTPLLVFFRYLWPTDAYLYSQSCEIHFNWLIIWENNLNWLIWGNQSIEINSFRPQSMDFTWQGIRNMQQFLRFYWVTVHIMNFNSVKS